MNLSVFDFNEYKAYLEAFVGPKGRRTGRRAGMARHLGCQTAYISQVLSAGAHLSLEQAMAFNEFAGHDSDSGHYFLLLVQKDRAGTPPLKDYFKLQLQELVQQRQEIKSRLAKSKQISAQDQNQYYSSWIFAAIHVALTIPELRQPQALAERFRLPLATVNQALEFLVGCGLAKRTTQGFTVGAVHLHLPRESKNILKHHTNWRLAALKSLDHWDRQQQDLHYAVAVSLSKEDVNILKEKILKLIDESIQVIKPSKEEVLWCQVIDFFQV